jgi:diaminopimelate decarboxylase
LLSFGKPEILSFRINPGIGKSNVGYFDITGGPEAKFGLHVDQAVDAYRQAQAAGIQKFGIHMMAGSCVTDAEYFKDITLRLFDIIGKIKQELNIEFEFVDLGGGLGIPYHPHETELDLDKAIAFTAATISSGFCVERRIGTASISASALKSIALPSMTG